VELRHLRYFLAVAEEGTVTAAARRVFVAQPALSRQIRDLERRLGRELFVRTGRGVEVTAAGRELLPRARAIVDQVDDAVRAVRSGRGPGGCASG
jgi:LysR family hca operon transcriptional activator